MIDGPSLMRWVVGYEKLYLVHRDGYVVNRLARTMTIKIDRYGYANVRLNRDGKQTWQKVHRLVCEAWHGRPPTGTQCAHLDGNPLNNSPENLAWVTAAENTAHKKLHGRPHGGTTGERHPMAKLTAGQVEEIRAAEESVRQLAARYGVSFAQISRIRSGKMWPKGNAHNNPSDTKGFIE